MNITGVSVEHNGDNSRVMVTTKDSKGNAVTYGYSGEVSTSIRANGTRFFSVEVTVTEPRKRDNAERNVPSGRFGS